VIEFCQRQRGRDRQGDLHKSDEEDSNGGKGQVGVATEQAKSLGEREMSTSAGAR
jgi:hypothetical protein